MKHAQVYTLQQTPLWPESQWLWQTIAGWFPELPAPIAVQAPEALLAVLGPHLHSTELFVIASEVEQFHALKAALLKGLGLHCEQRGEILRQQAQPYPEDAAFPPGAVVFRTEDARYNGFALRCGSQDMLVLPLHTALLIELYPQVSDYLQGCVNAKVLPFPREAAQVEACMLGMGQRVMEDPAPIEASAIAPIHGCATAIASPALTMAESEEKDAAPLPYYERKRMRLRKNEAAVARQVIRACTRRLAARPETFTLLLPPAWSEAAPLLGAGAFQPVVLAEEIASLGEALRLAQRYTRSGGSTYCEVITAPVPKGRRHLADVVLCGPSGHAQVQQVELQSGESPAQCAPEMAAALLAMLCGFAESDGAPPQNASLVARPPAAPDSQTPQRKGKLRAVVAACLAVATIAGSVLLGLHFQGNNARAADIAEQQAYVDAADAPWQGSFPVEEFLQYINPVTAFGDPEDQGLVIGTPLDAYQVFRMLVDFLARLFGYVYDAAPPPETTTAATTTSTSTSSTSTSTAAPPPSSSGTNAPPPPTSETTEPTTTTTTTTSTTTTTTTTTSSQNTPASKGTYYFTVIGFGHGVGLSQEGAKSYGALGWKYDEIIKHYYPGVSIVPDSGVPSRVTHDGVSYDLAEYLARIAYREIGRCGVVADEAIKAQMVCAYSVARRYSFKTTNNNQCLLSAADWNSDFAAQYRPKMLELARAVMGKYVAYNGAAAETLYFASCNGFTSSSQYVWNSAPPVAYLAGGRESPEAKAVTNPVFTTDQLRSLVNAYNAKNPGNAITLGSDASQWIQIDKVDPNGYIQEMRIGNRTFTGNNARLNFFGTTNLRSHNFTFTFTAG